MKILTIFRIICFCFFWKLNILRQGVSIMSIRILNCISNMLFSGEKCMKPFIYFHAIYILYPPYLMLKFGLS